MQFVDLEVAKAARGVRIVASAVVPSPWSEAAKAIFTVGGVPFVVTRGSPRDPAFVEWTRAHNVPVVFHDDEPPRIVWSQVVALAARLAPALLPREHARRIETMGYLHELAGEDGLAWNGRLLMIHASLTSDGARGFPLNVAKYLGAKYGYSADRIDIARTRARETLAALAARLGSAPYFGGDRPDALDAYCAPFLTPLYPITDAECPGVQPALRAAFGVCADEIGADIPPTLTAHYKRMFASHLEWPIAL